MVQYFQTDSVRVIARWSRPCDLRGCADSYRVMWTVGGVAMPTRLRTATVDTVRPPMPNYGDSLAVEVAVASVRRGLISPSRSIGTVIRRPDISPPPVDSLRVDTLAAVAYADTFTWTLRDTNGYKQGVTRLPGSHMQWCTIAKNKYTGVFNVVVGRDWNIDTRNDIERRCERARAAVAAEASG